MAALLIVLPATGFSLDGANASSAVTGSISDQRVLPYPFETVWPTAVRYLRVDRGFEIADRDAEAGYILFRFEVGTASDGSSLTGSGSLEAFRARDPSGRDGVSVRVSTDAGPTHLPHAILDGLAAKIRAERGQPAPPANPTEPDGPAPKRPPKTEDSSPDRPT